MDEDDLPSTWSVHHLEDQNVKTQMYKKLWKYRDKMRCGGECSSTCNKTESQHEKHLSTNLPEYYGKSCVIQQHNPRHVQDRYPENVGEADSHYLSQVTKVRRHPTRPDVDEFCCHGIDYETDSDDEDDDDYDDFYIISLSKWAQRHLVKAKPAIPAIGAMFVLWLFVMNYAIFGSAPAVTDR